MWLIQGEGAKTIVVCTSLAGAQRFNENISATIATLQFVKRRRELGGRLNVRWLVVAHRSGFDAWASRQNTEHDVVIGCIHLKMAGYNLPFKLLTGERPGAFTNAVDRGLMDLGVAPSRGLMQAYQESSGRNQVVCKAQGVPQIDICGLIRAEENTPPEKAFPGRGSMVDTYENASMSAVHETAEVLLSLIESLDCSNLSD